MRIGCTHVSQKRSNHGQHLARTVATEDRIGGHRRVSGLVAVQAAEKVARVDAPAGCGEFEDGDGCGDDEEFHDGVPQKDE